MALFELEQILRQPIWTGVLEAPACGAVHAPALPWAASEAAVAPKLSRQTLPSRRLHGEDLLGAFDVEFGCSASHRAPASAHPLDGQPAVAGSIARGILLQR